MTEVRFHGRGGQGAVIASTLLACSAFKEGMRVQAFPFFGVERRGAPVTAFTRIDDKKIRVKQQIYEPDYVIVLDPSLIDVVNVVRGLKPGQPILINTDERKGSFDFSKDYNVATVDASTIATELELGSKSSPIVNTALLGAFSRLTNLVKLESVLDSIRERIPVKVEENVQACEEAYKRVTL